jgi:molybdate transport system substrate-binding protein
MAWAAWAAVALTAGCSPGGRAPLLVYCASSMRAPMEEIAKLYEQKYAQRVDLSFGDSGTILIQADRRKAGDAFVAHDPFAAMAASRGLVESTTALAVLTPSIGVKTGTKGEQEVKGFADLARPGLRLALPDAEYSTCGNVLAAMLTKSGLRDAVMKNRTLTDRSSGSLVNALGLGSVDAVVAWDALIRRDVSLKVIPIEPEYKVDAVTSATGKTYSVAEIHVTISVLKSTTDAPAVRRLAQLAAGPEGRAIFRRVGFTPVSETPATK